MSEAENNRLSMSETAAVGSFLIDPAALTPLREAVRTDDFENPYCRRIFETACLLQDTHETLNAATVAGRLDDIPPTFFRELMDYTPSAAGVRAYGEAVHKAAMRRSLRAFGLQLAELPPDADPYDAVNAASAVMNSYSGGSSGLIGPAEQLQTHAQLLKEISSGRRQAVVPTGFASLDEILGGGMVYGGMYVLAARPGVGKTTLGLRIAENIARRGQGVLFVSLEMTCSELVPRRIAGESGLGLQLLTHLGLPENNRNAWAKYELTTSTLENRPFYISDRPQLSLAEIGMLARRIENPGCIVIDYIGLLRQDEGKSLYEKMTAVSNGVKRMAMALRVPVLALAQLNRESEHNPGGIPRLSELRDSGAIEQDADSVILLSRISLEEDALGTTLLRADVAKNRHGMIGQTQLKLWGISGMMADWPEDRGSLAG